MPGAKATPRAYARTRTREAPGKGEAVAAQVAARRKEFKRGSPVVVKITANGAKTRCESAKSANERIIGVGRTQWRGSWSSKPFALALQARPCRPVGPDSLVETRFMKVLKAATAIILAV